MKDYEGTLIFTVTPELGPLRFRYTNHDGDTEDRNLRLVRVVHGVSTFYKYLGPTYYLEGVDLGRDGGLRYFPLSLLLPAPQDQGMQAGKPRSSRWPGVRRRHLEEHPSCAACGRGDQLNVHHVMPYHLEPTLELDPANLITLCETPSHNCHFMFGHLLDWKAYNPRVEAEAAAMLAAIKARSY